MVIVSYQSGSIFRAVRPCTSGHGASCTTRRPARARGHGRPRPGAPLGPGVSAGRALSGDRAPGSPAVSGGRWPPEPARYRPADGGCRRAGRFAGCGAGQRLCQQPHAVFLFFRAGPRRRCRQQHGAGAGPPVGRRHPAGGGARDLQPAAQGGQRPAFRLPHRGRDEERQARRHPVPGPGRALPAPAGRADAGQPPRQDRARGQGRQRAQGQPVCGAPWRAAGDLELRPPQPAGRHARA